MPFFLFSLGTTYSCVANYEGTNVEISTLSSLKIRFFFEIILTI